MKAADKALATLNRVRAGIRADKRVPKKSAREEVASLFNYKQSQSCKRRKKSDVAWRHKFVCLAYKGQDKIPTTDYDKEELFQAGLGEKEIEFKSLDLHSSAFKEILFDVFPKLRLGGGYQLLKCLPNTRRLEVLSMAVHNSLTLLKQRVENARTYIRPIQKDLDLTPLEESIEAVCYYLRTIWLLCG